MPAGTATGQLQAKNRIPYWKSRVGREILMTDSTPPCPEPPIVPVEPTSVACFLPASRCCCSQQSPAYDVDRRPIPSGIRRARATNHGPAVLLLRDTPYMRSRICRMSGSTLSTYCLSCSLLHPSRPCSTNPHAWRIASRKQQKKKKKKKKGLAMWPWSMQVVPSMIFPQPPALPRPGAFAKILFFFALCFLLPLLSWAADRAYQGEWGWDISQAGIERAGSSRLRCCNWLARKPFLCFALAPAQRNPQAARSKNGPSSRMHGVPSRCWK